MDNERFSFLEGIIKGSMSQNSDITLMKKNNINEDCSTLCLNAFEKSCYGAFYIKNNLNKVIVSQITFKPMNMYIINSNDAIISNKLNNRGDITEKKFSIELKPNEEFMIIALRKLFYEPFCLDITHKYNVITINPTVKKPELALGPSFDNNHFIKLLGSSPKSPTTKASKVFDFIHTKFPIDYKKLCEIVNTKNNAEEMYSNIFPAEMREIIKIIKRTDNIAVTFYNKTQSNDKGIPAIYLGEWKNKNPFIKHGRGMFIYEDGSRYIGQIKDNTLDGFGKMYLNTGDIIEIPFLDDEMNGEGIKINKKGQRSNVKYDLGTLIE